MAHKFWKGVKDPEKVMQGYGHGFGTGWLLDGIGMRAINENRPFFRYSLDAIAFTVEFDEVQKILFEMDFEFLGQNEDGNNKTYHFIQKDSYVGIFEDEDGNNLSFGSLDAKVYREFKRRILPLTKEYTSNGKVFTVSTEYGDLKLKSVGVSAIEFEKGNYSKDIVEGFEHIVKDLNTSKPCGRIVLLNGMPGTGKTMCVRSIIDQAPDAIFVIFHASHLTSLNGPNFMKLLLRNKRDKGPIVLILEDADDCLTSRGADNISAISSLLNLSDGILGNLLDLRMICTSNVSLKDIDSAITRDGRLCSSLEFNPLEPEQANTVYKRLTGKDKEYDEEVVLATVYKNAFHPVEKVNTETKVIKTSRRVGFT